MSSTPGAPSRDVHRLPTAAQLGGLGAIVLGLALVFVVTRALATTLDRFGVVDRRAEIVAFLAALCGAVMVGLGTKVVSQSRWGRKSSRLAGLVVALVVLGSVWFLYVQRPDGEVVEGELSADAPFAHRVVLSGGNGYRYYITFMPAGSLSAEMQLRGGGQPVAGAVGEDGEQVVEGVLAGDTTWTAVLRHLSGAGRYLLFIDSSEPETLSYSGEELDRSLDIGRTRAGFTIDVPEPSGGEDRPSIFLRVEPRDPGQPFPGVVLRTNSGTPIANVPAGGADQREIFTRVSPGGYVVEVQGEPGQAYRISIGDKSTNEPSSEPSAVPTGTNATVPDVHQRPDSEAVALLTNAGFVVQSFPVCSGTLAAEGATVGTTRQVVRPSAGSVAEQEVVSLDRVEIPTLPYGTRLDVKAFSGLPCQ